MQRIIALFKKDLLVEFRNTFSLSSVILYVLATVYIIYTSFLNLQTNVWNVIFWIVFLFVSVNALIRTFNQEHGNRNLYYYQIASPVEVFIAKLLYNILTLIILGLLTWLMFAFITGNRVRDFRLFGLCILLGSIGLSAVFTFVAAIGTKTSNSQVLTAILGFPCVIPILLVILKLSANAVGLINDTAYLTDVLILLSVDVILIGISVLLFPYLWRE